MNEKMTAAGNQVKQAFGKIGTAWKNQEPRRKKLLIILAAGLIAFAIILGVVTNAVKGRYIPIHANLSADELTTARAVLEEANIPTRWNGNLLEVPAKHVDRAIGALAMKGIPSSGLDYSVFEKGGGLTTTDDEKQTYKLYQLQTRLENIIKTYPSISNAYVTLQMGTESNRVWETSRTKNTGSVKVDLVQGSYLTPDQISGIRYLVGSSAGIEPADITVVDTTGAVLAAAGEDYKSSETEWETFLKQMDLEASMENDLYSKATSILDLHYPDPEDYRVVPTVRLDYDAMTQEIMNYVPLPGTTHGVLEYDEEHATMGMGQYSGGVVGEDPNTDIPTYADYDGDGEADSVDYDRLRQFAVSYTKELREKGGPSILSSSIAVSVNGKINDDQRQAMRELVAKATGIDIANVSVQGNEINTEGNGNGDGENIGGKQTWLPGIPNEVLLIAAAILLLLILILILVLVLRRRASKKRLVAEEAENVALQEEAARVQREIEERKQQLKDAAIGDESENAIISEVRDFARANPEITANLLRNWLKEGET